MSQIRVRGSLLLVYERTYDYDLSTCVNVLYQCICVGNRMIYLITYVQTGPTSCQNHQEATFRELPF